eukprot:354787-Alexandrium_andersonii.AAC.1
MAASMKRPSSRPKAFAVKRNKRKDKMVSGPDFKNLIAAKAGHASETCPTNRKLGRGGRPQGVDPCGSCGGQL